ncbi:MAG: hypothetical protein LBG88_02815 [Christensenellaceae bacterium]|jgi:hypothetical protein|nr:hypothetical protein [Christensenellaceae bacterium]
MEVLILKCPGCGASLSEYQKECKYCGSPIVMNRIEAAAREAVENGDIDEDDNISKILDMDNSEPIVLYAEDGTALEFNQVALVPLHDNLYTLLCPTTTIGGIAGPDNAITFRIDYDEDECAFSLNVETKQKIIDEVMDVYNNLFDEANGANGSTGAPDNRDEITKLLDPNYKGNFTLYTDAKEYVFEKDKKHFGERTGTRKAVLQMKGATYVVMKLTKYDYDIPFLVEQKGKQWRLSVPNAKECAKVLDLYRQM